MANNIDLTICALECPLGTFQCSAWLIFRFRTESAFQAAPVFRSAYSASRNARPSAASRPPSKHTVLFLPKRSCSRFASLTLRLRAETFFQKVPVFRMAYFSEKAHCAFSSKTLMLQVRFAHPPNPAPSSRFFSISRRSGLRGCRHRAESTHHLTPSGCVPSGGAVAPPAPPLPPPSRCRPDRFKGSP